MARGAGTGTLRRERLGFAALATLWLLAAGSLAFGWASAKVQAGRREKQAADAFHRANLGADYDNTEFERLPDHSWRRVPEQRTWLERQIDGDLFHHVVVVGCDRDDDALFARLQDFPSLRNLMLVGPAVTDKSLARVRRLRGLKWLCLTDSAITDAGLSKIAALSALKGLVLARTAVGDEGLRHLRGLAGLTGLDLGSTKVTDAGLKELARMKRLESINLWETKVTAAGIADLRKALPSLKTVYPPRGVYEKPARVLPRWPGPAGKEHGAP